MTKRMNLILTILLWLLFFVVFAPYLRGATTSKHENSLGVVLPFENPNQYLAGSIASGTITEYNHKLYTVIRFKPFHTNMLFSQDYAFCGNESASFNGKVGPIVVTFSKVMHVRDCYDLYSVHEIKEEPLPQEKP